MMIPDSYNSIIKGLDKTIMQTLDLLKDDLGLLIEKYTNFIF